MKWLKTIVKTELRDNETICLFHKSKVNDLSNKEWWKYEEYTLDNIYNTYAGNEKVNRYWHEDGLCIILDD